MGRTRIEWATDVWNPVTGCTKVSAGCKHCYAERLVGRFDKLHGFVSFEQVECHPDRLEHPLHWKKPRRIFVVSLGDLFHEAVPFAFQCRVFGVMHSAKQHTFQILTKRPENMRGFIARYQAEWLKGFESAWPCEYPHVWLGVSVENQATADARIPILLQTPAAVRWLSVEPMLGRVDLYPFMVGDGHDMPHFRDGSINWVVCGGESGPKARPMHPDWARAVRDQCQEAGVAFFFKQWGEWCPPSQMPEDTFSRWDVLHGTENGIDRDEPWRVGKKAAGRLLDGREWNEFPERTHA